MSKRAHEGTRNILHVYIRRILKLNLNFETNIMTMFIIMHENNLKFIFHIVLDFGLSERTMFYNIVLQ